MRLVIRATVVALLVWLSAAPAHAQGGAQDFPNRPVKIVVPFPPGGPTDVMARIFGAKLSEQWGQPVVIENRAGGNSAIGAQQVAKSAPDGYTLLVAMDTTLVMNPITTANLPYDALKDFAPISLTAQNTSLLVVRADGPKTAGATPSQGQSGQLTTARASLRPGSPLPVRPARRHRDAVHPVQRQTKSQGPLTGSVDFDRRRRQHSADQGRQVPRARQAQQPSDAGAPDLQPLSVVAKLSILANPDPLASLRRPARPRGGRQIQAAIAAAAEPRWSKPQGFGIVAVS